MNFIPIFSAGGIGDLVISLAWIENIIRPLNISVHLYTNFPEIAYYFLPWVTISKDIRSGEHEKRNYDYFISISDMIFFERLSDKELPNAIQPLYEVYEKHKKEWSPYLKAHPMQANGMAHKALSLNQTRWTLPFYFVDRVFQPYIYNQEIKDIHIPQRFITIHDGFDSTGYYKFNRSTKSWDIKYWADFVKLFKEKYPDITVIQLGGVKHQKIQGVDINYAGQLTFEKSLEYLKSSLIHIDGDSGLVHARRLFNKPSIVIFGPTNFKYFGYPENINLAPNFCGDCWWNERDWMAKCIKGFETPKCMDSVTPSLVLDEVKKIIK